LNIYIHIYTHLTAYMHIHIDRRKPLVRGGFPKVPSLAVQWILVPYFFEHLYQMINQIVTLWILGTRILVDSWYENPQPNSALLETFPAGGFSYDQYVYVYVYAYKYVFIYICIYHIQLKHLLIRPPIIPYM